MGGAYGGRWASFEKAPGGLLHVNYYKPRTRPPGRVGRVGYSSSTLWGGVSGHSVNVRDQCGVCDVVTVRDEE